VTAGGKRRKAQLLGLAAAVASLFGVGLFGVGLFGCGEANTTAAATQHAVLAAYRDSHLDYLAVAETFPVNPVDQRLGTHITGPELLHVQAQLSQMKTDGQFIQGTIDLAAKVTSVTDTSATVTDCNLDRTVFVDGKTRQLLSQPSTQRTLVYAKLQLSGGVWKVVEFTPTGGRCLV
jgi:hypothetical protein